MRRAGAAALLLALLALPALAQPARDPMRQGPARGTLLAAQDGDTACYLRIRDPAGAVATWMASFDMCGAAPRLIGRALEFRWKAEDVMHPSCQGDTSCRRTLRVMLVSGMRPSP